MPKSNVRFWRAKLEGNKKRDAAQRRALRRLGWRVLVIWECWLGDPQRLAQRILSFLANVAHWPPLRSHGTALPGHPRR